MYNKIYTIEYVHWICRYIQGLYDSVNREKALECLCTSPVFRATDNDCEKAFRLNRSKYSKFHIFYLNINSIRNKFDSVRATLVNYVDIFIAVETSMKLTSLFLLLNLQLMFFRNLETS